MSDEMDCYNGKAEHDWYKNDRGLNYCRKCQGRQYTEHLSQESDTKAPFDQENVENSNSYVNETTPQDNLNVNEDELSLLRNKLDLSLKENEALETRIGNLRREFQEQEKMRAELEREVERLKGEMKELRQGARDWCSNKSIALAAKLAIATEALEIVNSGRECTSCSCACHVVAQQALEKLK